MGTKRRFVRSACSVLLCLLLCVAAAPGSAQVEGQNAVPAPDLPPSWAPFCDAGLLDGLAGPQAVAVCVPENQNPKGILLYSHGYVAPLPPPGPGDNPWLRINPVEIAAVTGLLPVVLDAGFIVAATTYSKEGYAIEAADWDLNVLIDAIRAQAGYLPVVVVGASEGGLIATMMAEKYPWSISGALALCGPVAGMTHQLNYLGDFRAVFDYYFDWRGGRRDVFPFGVADVPEDAYLQWPAYRSAAEDAIRRNLLRAAGLFRVTGAALSYNPFTRIDSAVETTLTVLRYSILGTNDLIATAQGGFPFGNLTTWYAGTFRDWHLNHKVERIAAAAVAAQYVDEWYTPHGNLEVPLVTLHTTMDPAVPYEHERIYRSRANDNLTSLKVWRYGHCEFTDMEILFALLITLERVASQQAGDLQLPDLSGYDLSGTEIMMDAGP